MNSPPCLRGRPNPYFAQEDYWVLERSSQMHFFKARANCICVHNIQDSFCFFWVDNRHSMLFKCLQTSTLNVSNLCSHPKQNSISQTFPQLLLYIPWKHCLNGRQGTKMLAICGKVMLVVYNIPFSRSL